MAGLLVTGFEAFGGDLHNPSGAAMLRLAAQKDRSGLGDASFHVLPVTWTGGPSVLAGLLSAESPTAVLMFGLASHAPAMRLERCAFNRAAPEPADNQGHKHLGRELVVGGAPKRETGVDVEAMASLLRAQGVPVEHSDDPGSFLCNAAYHTALSVDGLHTGRVLFVHVPATQGCGGTLPEETVFGWIEAAVRAYATLTGAGRGR